ncbi:MAG: archaellin/type IV pilin N-terminal domain-containing protein [Acidilobaceae archaeon]
MRWCELRAGRGLSPLVATLVLIAFTIVGGLIVYEYFQRASESFMSSGEDLIVLAQTSYTSNSKIVQLQMTNGYRVDVTISGYSYITSTSTTTITANPIAGNAQATLAPGAKHTVVLSVPHDAKTIIVAFSVKGSTLYKAVPLG